MSDQTNENLFSFKHKLAKETPEIDMSRDPSTRDLMRAINLQAQRIVDLETVVFEMQRQGQILLYAPDSRLAEAHQRLIECQTPSAEKSKQSSGAVS